MHTDEPVNLTVTKYKQTSSGVKPTGSSQDEENIGEDATPLQGVDFALYPITLQGGCTAADLKITSNNTAGTTDVPTVKCGVVDSKPQQTGTTDGNGKIVWKWENFSAVQYYVLQETNKPNNVTVSQDSLFGLPFYAMNTGNVAGYVYNLSVFPKNISTNQVNKSVDGPIVVQNGNTLTYNVSERIYNSKTGDNPPPQRDRRHSSR